MKPSQPRGRIVTTEEVFTWIMGVLFFGGLAGVAVFQMIFDDTGRKVGVGLLAALVVLTAIAGAARCIAWTLNRRGRR